MALRLLLQLQARRICSDASSGALPRAAAMAGTSSRRSFASSGEDDPKIIVECSPYRGHRLEPPSRKVETSKSELWELLTTMTRMRRMELAADQLYKTKLARGFLHLADGQEAIPAGMEAGITFQDSMIQSYRDHLTYMGRGGTVQQVAAELMGRYSGASKGIGGSMHLYYREHNYFGGSGIVGEQVPVGAGLAFAHKYRKDGSVAFAIYGDGAANQGQIFEAFNIAALWNLPCVFVVENNHYGMGTAEARAAKSPQYYTRGDYMPGMWVDGMDVLAVKNAAQYAKKYALEKGPLILEMDTYRYHGHSISDPGSSYRTRDEIQGMRQTRDPIEHVKTLLKEHEWADATQLKKFDKKIRADVNAEVEEAKKGEWPPTEFLWKNTYKDGLGSKMRPMEIGQEKIPV